MLVGSCGTVRYMLRSLHPHAGTNHDMCMVASREGGNVRLRLHISGSKRLQAEGDALMTMALSSPWTAVRALAIAVASVSLCLVIMLRKVIALSDNMRSRIPLCSIVRGCCYYLLGGCCYASVLVWLPMIRLRAMQPCTVQDHSEDGRPSVGDWIALLGPVCPKLKILCIPAFMLYSTKLVVGLGFHKSLTDLWLRASPSLHTGRRDMQQLLLKV